MLRIVFIAFLSFAATIAGILLWPIAPSFFRGQACDSEAVIATVKQLAVEKLNAVGGAQYLLRKGGSLVDHQEIRQAAISGRVSQLPMSIGAIRDRGTIGKGINCAGLVYMSSKPNDGPEFATEYSVEPTSDGKTIITAKFMPD